MLKTILVPIDGSDSSIRAMNVGLDIALKFNSKVVIMNVIRETIFPKIRARDVLYSAPTEGYVEYSNKVREVRNILLKEALEDAQKYVDYKLEIDTILLEGNPAEMILAEADAINADLIVIGSRGLGGIRELLMGSVGSAVVKGSKVPVTIVH